jgi:hypothetical protein
MLRRVALYAAFSTILLTACGTASPSQQGTLATQQPTAQFRLYSDQEAEMFAQRLEKLPPIQSGNITYSALNMLKQIGIDIKRLPLLTHDIGNCINTYTFDLSNSYTLFVDDDSCFPQARKASIRKK